MSIKKEIFKKLNKKITSCTKCELCNYRENTVFGTGKINTDLMIIGEAPGEKEDKQGKPFVGRSGKLLDKLLYEIGIEKKDIFIANILKCRPQQNRRPTKEETEKCRPYLDYQIDTIKPKIIVTLGLTAINRLLDQNYKMFESRNKDFYYKDSYVIATYHPAALLRNNNNLSKAKEDFKRARDILENIRFKENRKLF